MIYEDFVSNEPIEEVQKECEFCTYTNTTKRIRRLWNEMTTYKDLAKEALEKVEELRKELRDMDDTMRTLVRGLVGSWTSNRVMFTVFDITCALRFIGLNPDHEENRTLVHGMFEGGTMPNSYDRTLVSLAGLSVQPYVYHPANMDPRGKYKANQPPGLQVADLQVTSSTTRSLPSGVVQPSPRVTSAPAQIASVKTTNTVAKALEVDKYGRVRIPVNLLRGIGVNPSDSVYAAYSKKATPEIRISKKKVDFGEVIVPLKVDRYGNVKVSSPRGTGSKYTTSVINGYVDLSIS